MILFNVGKYNLFDLFVKFNHLKKSHNYEVNALDDKAVDSGLKAPGFKPPDEARKSEKYFLLFLVDCFGTYVINL